VRRQPLVEDQLRSYRLKRSTPACASHGPKKGNPPPPPPPPTPPCPSSRRDRRKSARDIPRGPARPPRSPASPRVRDRRRLIAKTPRPSARRSARRSLVSYVMVTIIAFLSAIARDNPHSALTVSASPHRASSVAWSAGLPPSAGQCTPAPPPAAGRAITRRCAGALRSMRSLPPSWRPPHRSLRRSPTPATAVRAGAGVFHVRAEAPRFERCDLYRLARLNEGRRTRRASELGIPKRAPECGGADIHGSCRSDPPCRSWPGARNEGSPAGGWPEIIRRSARRSAGGSRPGARSWRRSRCAGKEVRRRAGGPPRSEVYPPRTARRARLNSPPPSRR